mmetsp:Transcript_5623/g.8695  ORF Transcript_5623/g.8695 Transcript_5623/m.8695 type:complete len:266 (-) Transcript_5623:2475-3272(-)
MAGGSRDGRGREAEGIIIVSERFGVEGRESGGVRPDGKTIGAGPKNAACTGGRDTRGGKREEEEALARTVVPSTSSETRSQRMVGLACVPASGSTSSARQSTIPTSRSSSSSTLSCPAPAPAPPPAPPVPNGTRRGLSGSRNEPKITVRSFHRANLSSSSLLREAISRTTAIRPTRITDIRARTENRQRELLEEPALMAPLLDMDADAGADVYLAIIHELRTLIKGRKTFTSTPGGASPFCEKCINTSKAFSANGGGNEAGRRGR